MEIIEKYLPLNTKEKVDELMKDLHANPEEMTKKEYTKIRCEINKPKIQIYFQQFKSEFNYKPKNDNKKTTVKVSPQASEEKTNKKNHKVTSTYTSFEQLEDIGIMLPKAILGDNKYIAGTYIEMAFHNFYLTMNHICRKAIGKDIVEEAKPNFGTNPFDFANESYVWNPLFKELNSPHPEVAAKVEELYNKHFPFLTAFREYIKNATSQEYKNYTSHDILERISKTMRILRNVCAHSEIKLSPNQIATFKDNEHFILRSLLNCYKGSKEIIKARFNYQSEQMRCTDNYNVYQRPDNSDCHFTTFGIVAFASLFLEKKYSKIMSDKLHCVKKKDESIICEMLSAYRTRLFIRPMSSEKDTDAIALDILNELQRCPKELFDMLKPENQKEFRKAVQVDDTCTESEVLMIRHTDRFSHLLMKYIDDTRIFKNIRFQVSLGRYFHEFYNKNCIDNAQRVRSLHKDITGFGRITEIEEKRKEIWKPIIREYEDIHQNTKNEASYITDHRAAYVVNGNRVGLMISDNEDDVAFMPNLLEADRSVMAPTCWMSEYELPAMAFLLHLTNADSTVEEVIKQTVVKYKKLFEDIRDGRLIPQNNKDTLKAILTTQYGINSTDDIPKKLYNYLLSESINIKEKFNKWAETLIKSMIESTDYKKTKIDKQLETIKDTRKNKIGKRNYVTIKPGNLAQFLAKDIMFFQTGEDKLTGLNFQVLQGLIAQYSDGNFERLKRAFIEAHLTGDGGNPIITRLCAEEKQPKNTIEFYKAYLDIRKAYLTECLNSNAYDQLPFLHANRKKWQERDTEFYKALAGRYLKDEYGMKEFSKPLELPRGMFDEHIRKALSDIDSMKQLAADKGKNTSYLIYAYFMHVEEDNCQPFYNYARNYSIFDDLFRDKNSNNKEYRTPADIYTLLNNKEENSISKLIEAQPKEEKKKLRAHLSILKNTETDLKRYKVQDMLLFLIAKNILMSERSGSDKKELDKAISNIKLMNIHNGDVLSQKIPFSITVKTKSGEEKEIYQADLKLKNYIQFYRFLSDRRIESLLSLTEEDSVDRKLLEEEFIKYDKHQPDVLKEVLDYEREYFNANGLKKNGSELYDFNDMVRESTEFKTKEKDTLVDIRNSFAHLTYPKKKNVKDAAKAELKNKATTVVETFNNIIKSTGE